MVTYKAKSLEEVSRLLLAGKIGLFPFDTVWGITGLTRPSIIKRIFDIKDRPENQPLLMVIPDITFLPKYASSDSHQELINDVWPGPVTLIFKKKPAVPNEMTAGMETVAIRWPDYEPLNSVLNAIKQPLISTSANISKQHTATKRSEISETILSRVDFIYEQVDCQLGMESTIINCSGSHPKLLRKGALPKTSS